MDHAPPYEALSYAWGVPTTPEPYVVCHGAQLHVTENCVTALRRLRHRFFKRRLLWIDSICINQTNIPERNHQVTLMSKIYTQAKRVVVWLGESDDSSDFCIDQINLGGSRMEALESFMTKDFIQMLSAAASGRFRDCDEWLDDWRDASSPIRKAWDTLLNRSWFRRMWIIQEVVVAKDVQVVCGGKSTSYDFLKKIGCYIQGFSKEDLPPHQFRAMVPMMFRDEFREGSISIHQALWRTSDFLAKDGKDKVYALLGICDFLRQNMPSPDYHKTEAQVYLEAAKVWLRADRMLFILSHGIPTRTLPGLPSWCPDFGNLVTPTLPANSIKLGKKVVSENHYSNDGLILPLKGKIIDKVVILGEFAKWEDEFERPLVQESKTWKRWYAMVPPLYPYTTQESSEVVFWRTLFLDADDHKKTPYFFTPIPILTWHNHFMSTTTPDPAMAPSFPFRNTHDRYIIDVCEHTKGSAACVTEGGYFGLVNANSRVGDLVAYIQNSSVISLLRPAGDKRYRYVGACYVHGLMGGEKYPEKDAELEDIVLV
jgi:hypothetical protein